MNDRKPLWPWIVALLTGLPVLYIGSYAALVERTAWAFKATLPGDPAFIRPHHPIYSVTIPIIGGLLTGDDGWVGRVFAPVHCVDPKVRSEFWTFRIDP